MALLNKIVVCDDQDDIAHLVNMALGDAGYLCLRARDGEQALFLASIEAPDLLILDVMMPRVDGITACKKLKADPVLSRIPILMLTALADVDDKVKGLEAGADDYLAKPFDLRELLARVRALIRSSRRERDRSSVTNLPGPAAFEEAVDARIASGTPFALVIAELAGYDDFVLANGFLQGEALLGGVGRALASAARGMVLTHLGGDDFGLVAPTDALEEVSLAMKEAAADVVPAYGGPPVKLVITAVESTAAPTADGMARAIAAQRRRVTPS
ncbi:MAG: response regulator [Myxococcales bacterium]|nr:response regulator [Myxococcales bacterium]